ncbi:hypothetical protein ACFQ1I_12190 [Kitasatospora arboriphila]
MPALTARYTATTSTTTSKSMKADGGWRSSSRTSTTDPAHGNRIATSLDSADGLPDICTRTGYAAAATRRSSACRPRSSRSAGRTPAPRPRT